MDRISKQERSRNMAAVKGKDTVPERQVRSALHQAGFRYSLHRKDLPGKPDLTLPKYRMVIFVHGCFWHGHDCPRGRRPSSNVEFWNTKLDRNIERDLKNHKALRKKDWNVHVLWECKLDEEIAALLRFLKCARHRLK